MRSELRQRLKAILFDQQVTDDYARVRVAYYTWAATLQPVATFFNALRARQSLAQRAGGRSARSGPSYINGAAFNPRTLTAMLNNLPGLLQLLRGPALCRAMEPEGRNGRGRAGAGIEARSRHRHRCPGRETAEPTAGEADAGDAPWHSGGAARQGRPADHAEPAPSALSAVALRWHPRLGEVRKPEG